MFWSPASRKADGECIAETPEPDACSRRLRGRGWLRDFASAGRPDAAAGDVDQGGVAFVAGRMGRRS
nr:unnamed protein product [Digitaria exilis]